MFEFAVPYVANRPGCCKQGVFNAYKSVQSPAVHFEVVTAHPLRRYSSPSHMLAVTKAVTAACTASWTAAATAVS